MNQAIDHMAPTIANTQKAERHPHLFASLTVSGGVIAAPSREKACVSPCANARSVDGTHCVSARVAVGKAPASPTPRKNRANQNEVLLHAPTITAVSTDQ